MKQIIKITFILICFSTFSFSQSSACENILNFQKAESYYYNKKKDSAMIYYQLAYADSSFGRASNCLNTMPKAIEAENLEFFKKLVKISLSKGHLDTNYYNDYLNEQPKLGLRSIFEIVSQSEYEHICSDYNTNLNNYYIQTLQDLLVFDQSIRKSDFSFNLFQRIVSKFSYDILIKLIEHNNNEMITYKQLGADGSHALSGLIKHLDLDQLINLSPYIIKAIKTGNFWGNEDYLYQLERSSMDQNVLIKLNDLQDSIVVYGSNVKFENTQNLFYSNYGGMDYYINKEVGAIWWPINPQINIQIVNQLRAGLCLLSLQDLFKSKPHVKFISIDEFIKYVK